MKMISYKEIFLVFMSYHLLASCTYNHTNDGIEGTIDTEYLEERLCAGNSEISKPIINGQGGQLIVYEYRSADGTLLKNQEELKKYEHTRKVNFFNQKYKELEREDEAQFKEDQNAFYQCLTENKLWHLYYSSFDIMSFVKAESPWDKKRESLSKENDTSNAYYYIAYMSPPSIYHYHDSPKISDERIGHELKEIERRFDIEKMYIDELSYHELAERLNIGFNMSIPQFYPQRRLPKYERLPKGDREYFNKKLPRYEKILKREQLSKGQRSSTSEPFFKARELSKDEQKQKKDLAILSRRIEKHCPFPRYTPRKFENYGFEENHSPIIKSEKYIQHRTLDMSKVQFTRQEDPNMCWAATLEMAFAYNGNHYNKYTDKYYEQQDFLDTLKSTCLKKLSKKATVNQMLYAATAVHLTSGGVWLRNGNSGFSGKTHFNYKKALRSLAGGFIRSALGIPSLFSASYGVNGQEWFSVSQNPKENKLQYLQRQRQNLQMLGYSQPVIEAQSYSIPWKTTYDNSKKQTEGGIFFANHTGELLVAISNEYPMIAGRSGGGFNHTVLITGIVAEEVGSCNIVSNTRNANCTVDERVKIMQFQYLDPMKSNKPIWVDGDDFLASTEFIFYVKP